MSEHSMARRLVAAGLTALLLGAMPLAYSSDGEKKDQKEALENVIEKEKQKNEKDDRQANVGETEFSNQDCSDVNRKKEAGGDVSQKDLDDCEIDSVE